MGDPARALLRSLAVGLAVVAGACAPPATTASDPVLLESICVRSLQELDSLIATTAAAGTVSGDAIAEARALRSAAADLYLDGDSELALELIDQAFVLLGTRK
jgi:hypothetical protein